MKLYAHQVRALKEVQGHDRVAFYVDMGGGKTFIGSEQLVKYDNRINLLICQKSKVDDWMEHFYQNYDSDHIAFDLTRKADYEAFFGCIKVAGCQNRQVIGIINYELAWRRPLLGKLRDFTLMLDESSMIQNEQARKTKFILGMKPKNVILLSGTPTSGRYGKLWSQCRLLGWNITKGTFYDWYIIQKLIEVQGCAFKIPVVTGYKNVDNLKAKLKEHGAVFMKSDEFGIDLPQQVTQVIRMRAPTAYRAFMKNRMVVVDGNELIGDTSLTMRLYARQLCSQYNKNRLQAFADLLESCSGRLIVFYNFTAEMQAFRAVAEKYTKHISIVNGATKDLTAYEQYDDSVTFVQYQAGAMGLNLQKAHHMCFASLPERSELFEQAKKRIHRIGQKHTCFYYILQCPCSIEVKIHQALKMRKDYTDELFRADFP